MECTDCKDIVCFECGYCKCHRSMEWVKCSDRLPTQGESVGYTYDGKSIRHDVSYPGYNGSWESENSIGFYVDERNITHWMPLPQLPEAK